MTTRGLEVISYRNYEKSVMVWSTIGAIDYPIYDISARSVDNKAYWLPNL
jgi:hypothetical protein